MCPGPPVTFQSLAPAAAASTAPAPRSPSLQAANMEELLKGIPPNVSIPTTADQQTGGLVELSRYFATFSQQVNPPESGKLAPKFAIEVGGRLSRNCVDRQL